MSNNPIKFNDPTGHMQESDEYEDRDGKCDSNDKGCNNLVDRISKKKDRNKDRDDSPGMVDFVSISAGISVPGAMVLVGGLLCLSAAARAVGGPLAETGLSLIPTFANAFSIGPAFTLDSYGNTYASFQVGVGKTVPGVPIGGSIVGYKIDSSDNYVNEQENRNFITEWSSAVNTIGFPGLSGARLPPTGKSLSWSSGETATSGTFIGTTVAEGSISYTWELPIDIGNPDSPWGSH